MNQMRHHCTTSVRMELGRLLAAGKFTNVNREATMTSIVGKRTVEIVGATFLADEDAIFGTVDWGYVQREEEWYDSMSRSVHDIPGGAPTVWRAIASRDGRVNSNYGWCVYSPENGRQFERVVGELRANPESRRAVIIYTRPSMWDEYNEGGRSDFMCTNVVQYLVRDGQLHAHVQMRSNDAVLGYKNDRAWQATVQRRVAQELGLPVGDLLWTAGSLHVYERHFYLVDFFNQTGSARVTRSRYRELYPASAYCGTEV